MLKQSFKAVEYEKSESLNISNFNMKKYVFQCYTDSALCHGTSRNIWDTINTVMNTVYEHWLCGGSTSYKRKAVMQLLLHFVQLLHWQYEEEWLNKTSPGSSESLSTPTISSEIQIEKNTAVKRPLYGM